MQKEKSYDISQRNFCSFFVLALTGCATTEGDWGKAKSLNTVGAYQEFLTRHPQSEFSAEAKSQIKNMDWIEWKCDTLNARSRAAAVRLGFSFEGIFRQHYIIKGRNRDTAWFSMLDKDWLSIKNNMKNWLYTEECGISLSEINKSFLTPTCKVICHTRVIKHQF